MSKYNDNELIYLISDGEYIYFECLVDKYLPLIINRLVKYKIPKLYFDDYIQEGINILYKCVDSFRDDYGYAFNSYFDRALQNKICLMLRKDKRYFSIVTFCDNEVVDYLVDKNDEVTNRITLIENLNDCVQSITPILSLKEKIVLDKMQSGLKPRVISKELQMDISSVYNAIKRIKKKVNLKI